MTYDIDIHPDAAEYLATLTKRIQRQIDKKIMGLAQDPKPANARQLTGEAHKGIWKIRSGNYRILYQIRQNKTLVVYVVMIGDRQDVYKKLKRILSQP